MKIYPCMPHDDVLDFWIKENLNVLLYGRHGVGKTSLIVDAFNRNKVRFQHFSAATMDPWVDFIGVPKELKDEKGSYLELIRPKVFRDDEVEALFFDEFNRSHKKVRNAVMELIQFKSINGRKFPNLRMIWAAVNPDEDDTLKYDVEKMDPAQADRFHIHIEIPYKPSVPYFREKFGREQAQAAIDWWQRLPDPAKLEVSPRRLEIALKMFKSGGELLHVLPPHTNVSALNDALKYGSPMEAFNKLLAANNEVDLKAFLNNENNYSACREHVLRNADKCVHLLSEEKLSSIVSINEKAANYVFDNGDKFAKLIEQLSLNSQNRNIRKRATETWNKIQAAKPVDPKALIFRKPARTVANNAKYVIAPHYKWNAKQAMAFAVTTRHYGRLESNINNCIAATSKAYQTPERIRVTMSAIKIAESMFGVLLGAKIEDAKAVLSLLEWGASRMQSGTVLNIENYQVAVNRCVGVIRLQKPTYSVSEFATEYPNICGKVIYAFANPDWCIIR